MILPLTEVDSIRYIHKANKSHERAFESIIDKVYREDKERKEKADKAKLERENKKRKEELEKLKETQDKQQKEVEKLLEETKVIVEEQPQPQFEEKGVGLGSTWSEVSPEQASQYMASKTGVPASRWMAIIYHESTNNPTVTNSIGCFGYLQLHPVHGAVSQMTPHQYLDTAVGVYQSQGLTAWEVVTMGRA